MGFCKRKGIEIKEQIMGDKERIEEMARDIAKKDCYLFENCPKEHKHNCISQDPNLMIESSKNYITTATWLTNEGWVKMPKDSVVISKSEYEMLKSLPNKIIKYMDRHLGDWELSGNILRKCAKQFSLEIKE